MNIGIIGGGPAGMFAAIEASKRYQNVMIFDNNKFLGRKLSATGAGRCNLTNVNVSPRSYRSFGEFEYGGMIQQYGFNFIHKYLEEIGIFTYHTDDGWVYPLSNSASNVALLLEDKLVKSNVSIRKNIEILDIIHRSNQFILKSNSGASFQFDRIVLATGGRAYPQLNANDKILNSMHQFGHNHLPAFPALAPLKTSKDQTNLLNGVRLDTAIRIIEDNKLLGSDIGNIIFTEWGLNGPGVMNLSHLVHQRRGNLRIEIDLNPSISENFIDNLIKNNQTYLKLQTPFLSIFNTKIIDQLSKNCGLDPQKAFNIKDFKKLMTKLIFSESIIGTRDFQYAQISTGAIESSQVNHETLESKLRPGLYFAGELLDVFGPCGGYNLHWAFISGIVAGRSI
jgi:hypothetical protein